MVTGEHQPHQSAAGRQTLDRVRLALTNLTVFGSREGTHRGGAIRVSGGTLRLRGITITEMSMGDVQDNEVAGGVGVGIFCGDYSECMISGNAVSGTRPDHDSDDLARKGIGIVAHYGAKARLSENAFVQNTERTAAFSGATIRHE